MFYLAAKFVKGFIVANFWSAFWAAILFSIISFLLNIFLNPKVSVNTGSFNQRPPDEDAKYHDAIDVEGKVEK